MKNPGLLKALLIGSESPYAKTGYISADILMELLEDQEYASFSENLKKFLQDEYRRAETNKRLKNVTN